MDINSIETKALKALGKFFKTDPDYLVKNSFWIVVARVVSVAMAFLISIAYARYLSKDLYGSYRYILSIFSIASIFTLPGLGTSLARAVAQGKEYVFRDIVKIRFLASLGLTITGLLFAAFLLVKGDAKIIPGLIVAALLMPFAEGTGSFLSWLDGKKMFREKSIFSSGKNILSAALILISVLFISKSQPDFKIALTIMLLAYLIGNAIPNIIYLIKTWRLSVKNEQKTDKDVIRYGMHLSLGNVPSTIATYLDGILLFNLLGPSSLAIYSFAVAPPEQLKGLLNSIANISLPKFSTMSLDEIKKILMPKIWRVSIFTLLLVIIYIVTAPLIFEIFFPRYLDAVKFSQIFALSLVILPFSIINAALQGAGEVKKNYLVNIIPPIVQIALLVSLIPIFGLWGAILARVVGRLFGFGFLVLMFKI